MEKNKNRYIDKKKNKEEKEPKVMSKKARIIAIVAICIGAVLVILTAIFAPIIKINADFDNIFKKADEMENITIKINDMMGGGEFAHNNGEVIITDKVRTEDVINKLLSVSDDFKYDSRDQNPLGAWDYRIKFISKSETVELYIAKDSMYYVKRGVKYIFVPDNEIVAKKYETVFADIIKLLK